MLCVSLFVHKVGTSSQRPVDIIKLITISHQLRRIFPKPLHPKRLCTIQTRESEFSSLIVIHKNQDFAMVYPTRSVEDYISVQDSHGQDFSNITLLLWLYTLESERMTIFDYVTIATDENVVRQFAIVYEIEKLVVHVQSGTGGNIKYVCMYVCMKSTNSFSTLKTVYSLVTQLTDKDALRTPCTYGGGDLGNSKGGEGLKYKNPGVGVTKYTGISFDRYD